MTTGRIHQVLVGADANDAITLMALEIRRFLSNSFESLIFSFHPIPKELSEDVVDLSHLEKLTSDDILIYHLSFGIPELTKLLLERNEKLIIAYHNVTPSKYYAELLPEFSEALRYGKEEPVFLRHKAALTIAMSEFSATELREIGFDKVSVVPGGVNPFRLDDVGIDLNFLVDVETHFPNGFILFVSQVLPHKRVDHAIEILHLLRTVHRLDIGLVIAGPIRQPAYEFAVNELRSRLDDSHLLMTGAISDQQLATLYRSCLCYIGTSEHEGLSVPPLEAMANRAPVVVLGAGAVPETVTSGGFVLPVNTGVIEFTELVAEVIQNESLQSALRRKGVTRISEGFGRNTAEQFIDLVMGVVA
jgi:L-malate glycosyltransferase